MLFNGTFTFIKDGIKRNIHVNNVEEDVFETVNENVKQVWGKDHDWINCKTYQS